VVDALWGDQKARQLIWLGKWTLSCTLPFEEDMLLNYQQIPYSSEINQILGSHADFLHSLVMVPETVSLEYSPALAYLQGGKAVSGTQVEQQQIKNGLIMFTGGLSVVEQAMVYNWFEQVIPGAKTTREKWLQKAPIAHAINLILAERNRTLLLTHKAFKRKLTEKEHTSLLLQKAWDLQCSQHTSHIPPDVDREAIGLLEKRMFETSKAAGKASYQQWGLDAGEHQDKWSPYPNVPAEWNLGGIAEAEDTEYQVSLVFCA
jgi:hypothetical protein